MADIVDKITGLSGAVANMGVAVNNAIESMGGLGLSMSNLLEFGNKINVSLVAAERSLSMYGKTADGIAVSTAKLSRQFSLPYEDMLAMQQDLAMKMPVAITGQEKMAAVVQFAGDRFGMTSDAIKGYAARLEGLSQKAYAAYEDQLLMIDAAEKLRTAQLAGAADVGKLSDSLMRQAQVTKANAEMMYAMGKISRDELATIIRTTEGLSEQSKQRLVLAETATVASNVLANESKIMYSMIGNLPEVQEAVKGLTLAPSVATAEMMKKMTSRNMDVGDLGADTEDAAAFKKELSSDTIASFEQLFAKGMDLNQAKAEMMKAASEGGAEAEAMLEYMLEQKEVADALKNMESGRVKSKEAQEKMENAIATAMKDGNTANLAGKVIDSLRLQTMDRLRVAQTQLTEQAKVHGSVVNAINEAYNMQAEMLGKISGLGADIGDQSANDSAFVLQMRQSMDRELKSKQAILEIEKARLELIQRGQSQAQANPADREKAAQELLSGFEAQAAEAQKLIDAEKNTGKKAELQAQQDDAKKNAQAVADALKAGQYDQVETMIEQQRQSAISASNDVTKTTRENNRKILDSSVARFKSEFDMRQSEVSQIEAQLSLMDSVASGIGASAEMRAAAVQKMGEQVSTVENEMAELTRKQQDFVNKAAEAEQRLVEAQAAGNQKDIEAANNAIMANKEAAADAQKKLNEADTKRLGLIKQQLDMTKQIREGYLDALSSMMEGAGVFAEIVVDQEKNLGTLLRTAKDMPTSLRTGAADGRGAEMSTFGVGGIQAGEWSQDMASYTNELVSSQIPEITDYLKQIAGRATGDVASLNADRLGAAMDQAAAAGGAARSVGGAPPVATPAAAATSSAAGTSASTGQLRLDDSVVASISSQVAAMAKEQVVPAIIDGFAMAMKAAVGA